MPSPISQAIKQICEEKNIPYEAVLETIESALASAYRKDFGDREKPQNIKVQFDPETAGMKVFDVKTVVEDMELPEEGAEDQKPKTEDQKPKTEEAEEEGPKFNPKTMIMISEAKKIKPKIKIDEEIRTELEVPGAFGRMAAQTAKQVIMQKIREVERDVIYTEFKEQEHTVVAATVQRREGRVVLFDLGRTTAVMPPEDQAESERYNPGERMKVYIKEVVLTSRGPQIVVSRTHPELVRKLFEIEIPEVADGAVEVKAIAREAGSRSKVAVTSSDSNIDPIGSCIGQRGTRIQTVTGELGGEKIDIIPWDEDPTVFISGALSPAKVNSVVLDEEAQTAVARVPSDQLSLAIGKGGQNVRLAAKLTGWKLNVVEVKPSGEEGETAEVAPAEAVATEAEPKPESKPEPLPPEASEEAKEEEPESKPEPEPEEKSEPKPESKPEPEEKSEPELKPESEEKPEEKPEKPKEKPKEEPKDSTND